MVDVSAKPATRARGGGRRPGADERRRRATWRSPAARKKGDVRAAAEIAGIMAAKKTAELIPLCHPLALSKAEVRIEPADDGPGGHRAASRPPDRPAWRWRR